MKKISAIWQRFIASLVLIVYCTSCTNLPSGEKAFDSFESCYAANLGLATLGGLGIGLLTREATKSITGNTATANVAGISAGIAAGTLIGVTAWRKCAAVYNKSEQVTAVSAQAAPQAPGPRRSGPLLNRLEVRVDGTENDPPVPEFDFAYYSPDPGAKDIKARIHHKVEIVRFMAGDGDKLVLADANGTALLENGKPIPLEAANRIPRERMAWVTIADEGKEDYVEDVVIQQGPRNSFRHHLQVPPRAKLALPLPMPMRYSVTIETDTGKSSRTVDFAILPTNERPKRFVSNLPGSLAAAANSGSSGNTNGNTSTARSLPAGGFVASHTTLRQLAVFSETGPARKLLATLKKGTRVQIEDRTTLTVNKKPVEWVFIRPEKGTGGWAPASELAAIK
jgi:hypothetical protein